jgi:hypothetical protein
MYGKPFCAKATRFESAKYLHWSFTYSALAKAESPVAFSLQDLAVEMHSA